jgi:hypothetical protein
MSQVSKQKQRERIVAQFMNFTQANEKNAIHFLNQHDWKLDLAVDAYYLSLDSGPRVANAAQKSHGSVDRRKLDQIWNLYKGKSLYFCSSKIVLNLFLGVLSLRKGLSK